MSNKIQVFDLSNASNVSLTSTGFKREGESAKYVCKITDATIVFVGDNSKFVADKKKQFNTISITLPEKQSEEFKRILDETKRDSLSYSRATVGRPGGSSASSQSEYEGEIQFKVKLSPSTKIVNNDKKPIKIDLQKVPCSDLREYKDATIDIVVTGTSNEFEGKNGEMRGNEGERSSPGKPSASHEVAPGEGKASPRLFSYISLTATQIKIKSMNSVFDCDFL